VAVQGGTMTLVSELSPEDYARSCLGGDAEAFGSIYDLLARDVQRLLVGLRLGLDHQQVEDLVQEAFVRLFRRLSKLDLSRPLKPYLMGIARNLAIDHWRRAKPARELTVDPLTEADAALEVGRAEWNAAVGMAMGALEPELRSALVMRHTVKLTMTDLADVLGCSVPTARARLKRAALMLGVELRKRGVFPGEDAA
jgi:RNA polymerase sigma-70 factor (ECF subfamily)